MEKDQAIINNAVGATKELHQADLSTLRQLAEQYGIKDDLTTLKQLAKEYRLDNVYRNKGKLYQATLMHRIYYHAKPVITDKEILKFFGGK